MYLSNGSSANWVHLELLEDIVKWALEHPLYHSLGVAEWMRFPA